MDRVVAALEATNLLEKYISAFMENDVDDVVVEKCLTNPTLALMFKDLMTLGHKIKFLDMFQNLMEQEKEDKTNNSNNGQLDHDGHRTEALKVTETENHHDEVKKVLPGSSKNAIGGLQQREEGECDWDEDRNAVRPLSSLQELDPTEIQNKSFNQPDSHYQSKAVEFESLKRTNNNIVGSHVVTESPTPPPPSSSSFVERTQNMNASPPWLPESLIDPTEYVIIRQILENPENINPNTFSSMIIREKLEKFLPYIIQRIKMWGTFVLLPQNLARLQSSSSSPVSPASKVSASPLVNRLPSLGSLNIGRQFGGQSSSSEGGSGSSSKNSIRRLDVLNYLIHRTDPIVMQDLFRIISFFPVSLPILVPVVNNCEAPYYKALFPLLKTCTIKWSRSHGGVCENNLFQNSFKLISAVSIGPSGSAGKSSILNQMLRQDNYIFSSCQEPGSSNSDPPLTSRGTTELTWLTEETCSRSFWEIVNAAHYSRENCGNEVLLLANLHGDSLQLPDHLKLLDRLSSSMVLLLNPGTEDQIYDRLSTASQQLSPQTPVFHLMVDPQVACEEAVAVNTNQLANSTNIAKVCAIFGEAAKVPAKKVNVNDADTIFKNIQTITPLEEIGTPNSVNMAETVCNIGCSEVKHILKLQQRQQQQQQTPESIVAELGRDQQLQHFLDSFIKILNQPHNQRRKSFVNFDAQISLLSLQETLEVRKELIGQRQKLAETCSKPETAETKEKIGQLQQSIQQSYKLIDQKSLGLEHFHRELATVYEAYMATVATRTDFSRPQILGCARKCAEMLLEGQPLEILDGDKGQMSPVWLNSVLHEVCLLTRKQLRVFVVSILGLQSSGKSTLLNALFGCKFAVSAGRCTRGLFLRFLFLEPAYAEKVGVDALLIIDTEGLGAPEKMNEKDAEQNDRLMATFAVSISNLTIVNVLGESLRDISEILQIVILTVGRIKEANLSPEILVVQHTSEKNLERRAEAADQFIKALRNAIETAEKGSMRLGVANVNALKSLDASLKNGDLFVGFPAFKDGASVNAPPSLAYHQEVVKLFENILKRGRTNNVDFHKWHDRLPSFWEAVKRQEFSLRFKNIVEMQHFYDRGDRIFKIKEKISLALLHHETIVKSKLNSLVNERKRTRVDNVIKEIDNVLDRCQQPYDPSDDLLTDLQRNGASSTSPQRGCRGCLVARFDLEKFFQESVGKDFEQDVKKTMRDFQTKCLEDERQALSQYFAGIQIQRNSSHEFDNLINNNLRTILRDNPVPQKMTDSVTRRRHVQEIWKKLENVVRGNTDTEYKEKIYKEVYNVYKGINDDPVDLPVDMGKNLVVNASLFDQIEFNLRRYQKVINGVIPSVFLQEDYYNAQLKPHHREQLLAAFDNLAKHILYQNGNLPHYLLNRELATKLREKISTIITSFQDIHRPFKNQYLVCQIAISIFLSHIYKIEDDWAEKNSALGIFMNKKDFYMEKVDTAVKYGFGIQAEGENFAACLNRAIEETARRTAEHLHQNEVLGISWLTNSSNIRLAYFSELTRQIQANNLQAGIDHFNDPKGKLELWFRTQVDRHSTVRRDAEYTRVCTAERNRLVVDVGEFTTINEFLILGRKYCQAVGMDVFIPQEDTERAVGDQVIIFRDIVLKKLNTLSPLVGTFMRASEDRIVLGRLGCTSYCKFCGAICWGQSGHEENADATKKHHTSHQPQGLAFWRDSKTKVLCVPACHTISDSKTYYLQGNDQVKVPWREAKVHHLYSDWIYTEHAKAEFNELMNWFFVKLHEEIARQKSCRPADQSEIHKLSSNMRDVGSILAGIRASIGAEVVLM